MNKFKKAIFIALSFTMALSTFAFAACGGSDNSESSKQNNSTPNSEISSEITSDSSVEDSSDDGTNCEHVWSEWELESEATCLDDGVKVRTCLLDDSHVDRDTFSARGHDYGNIGVCIRCELEAEIPAADKDATYLDVSKASSGIAGTGKEYEWFQLTCGGYYEIPIGNDGIVWANFNVEEAGQYMLYSVRNDGVTAKRYDASAQYIPVDFEGNYIGYEARVLKNGNFVSTVNCGELYYNEQWRATYSFSGEPGSFARIHIVKIDTFAWMPGYAHITAIPEQINGKHAPAGPEGKKAAVVPYESAYFLDDDGYYRLGTPENPGELIYLAVTAIAPRMLLDKSFCMIQYEGNNLSVPFGMTVEGDYLIKSYAAFFMNNGGDISGTASADPSANCYENYVNSDGLYPVNEELYEFLQLYLKKNKPMDIPDDIWNNEVLREKCAWLAPCYYYADLEPGTKNFPISLEIGENTITTKAFDYLYYNLKYYNDNSEGTVTYCTITTDNANALLLIGEETFTGPFSVTFECNDVNGMTFMFAAADATATSYTVNITTFGKGSVDEPIALTDGDNSLNPVKIMTFDTPIYEAYHVYVANADGTLVVSSTSDALILVDGEPLNGDATQSYSVAVTAGQVISVYVSSTSEAPIDVNISVN